MVPLIYGAYLIGAAAFAAVLSGCGKSEPGVEPVDGPIQPLPPPSDAGVDAGPDAPRVGRNVLSDLANTGRDLYVRVNAGMNCGRIRISNAQLRDLIGGDAGAQASGSGVWASEPLSACPPATSCSNAVIARSSGSTRLNIPGARLLTGAYSVYVVDRGDHYDVTLESAGYNTEGSLEAHSGYTLLMVYPDQTCRAGAMRVMEGSDAGTMQPMDGGITPLDPPDGGGASDAAEAGAAARTFAGCTQTAGSLQPTGAMAAQAAAAQAVSRPDAGVGTDAAGPTGGADYRLTGENTVVVRGPIMFSIPKNIPTDGSWSPAANVTCGPAR